MGRFKWKELGLEYRLQDIEPPAQELIQRVIGQFAKEGLKAY
jgi:pyruvate formate lyase activating enzyme